MELVYLWIDKYKNIENQNFNFSPYWDINYSKETQVLNIKERTPEPIPKFFGDKISNVTAIIGENGSGKSTLLEIIALLNKLDWVDFSFQTQFLLVHCTLNERGENIKNLFLDKNAPISDMSDLSMLTNIFTYDKHPIDRHWKINRLVGNENLDSSFFEKEILTHVYYNNIFDGELKTFQRNRKDFFDLSVNNLHNMEQSNFRQYEVEWQFKFFTKFEEAQIDIELGLKIPDLLEILPNGYYEEKRFLNEGSNEDEKNNFGSLINAFDINKDDILSRIKWNRIIAGLYDQFNHTFEPEKVLLLLERKEYITTEDLKSILKIFNIHGSFNFIEKLRQGSNKIKLDDIISLVEQNNLNYSDKKISELKVIIEFVKNKKIKLTDDIILFASKSQYERDFISDFFNWVDKELIDYVDKNGKCYIPIIKENRKIINRFRFKEAESSFSIPSHVSYDWKFKGNDDMGGLSSGEKAWLSLFARFYSMDISSSKHLIILIDEGEIGFHPNWQKKYLSDILKIFNWIFKLKPSVQLILTSHSPFLVSDLPKNNIIFMAKDGKVVSPEHRYGFGANIHDLYSSSFFMENGLIGKFAENKINEILEWLYKVQPFDDEILENDNTTNPDKKEKIQKLREAKAEKQKLLKEEKENYIIKRTISLIDEPIIKEKLELMYAERMYMTDEDKRSFIEQRLRELENDLKNQLNLNDNDSNT